MGSRHGKTRSRGKRANSSYAIHEAFRDPTDDHIINLRLFQYTLNLFSEHTDLADTEKHQVLRELSILANKLACAWVHRTKYSNEQDRLVRQAQANPIVASESQEGVHLGLAQRLLFEADDFMLHALDSVDRAFRFSRVLVGQNKWPFTTFNFDRSATQLAEEVRTSLGNRALPLAHALVQHGGFVENLREAVYNGFDPSGFTVAAFREDGSVRVVVPQWSRTQTLAEAIEDTWWSVFLVCEDLVCACIPLRLKESRGLVRLPGIWRSALSPWVIVPTDPTTPIFREAPQNLETAIVQSGSRPMIQAVFQGRRFRAVYNSLFPRPIEETFHEFLWDLLKLSLGKSWYMSEVQKAYEERHQIVQWFFDLAEWQKARGVPENKTLTGWGAIPDGNVQALTSLAYDIYTLRHSNVLSASLLDRLRDRREFQGARYEIAVAAVFLRAGFALRFLKETGKHGEFVATHNRTGIQVGVEAKSRRRQGVLHEEGALDPHTVLRGDIQHLFDEARSQKVKGLPFVIFIDLNCPPSTGVSLQQKPWWDDVKACFDTYEAVREDKPDEFNALILTNFSTHYFREADAQSLGESYVFQTRNPVNSLPEMVLADLNQSVKRYGLFPADPEERSS